MSDSTRPRFLTLYRLRFPIGAWVSIGHRLSGILLFLSLPAAGFLLQQSLRSPAGFAQTAERLSGPALQIPVFLLLWSLMHHLLAGLRYLALDTTRIGPSVARAMARGVALGGFLMALGLVLWGPWR
jgi:succinate dehydrogenase / fumarate reductase cytochrome b subunit